MPSQEMTSPVLKTNRRKRAIRFALMAVMYKEQVGSRVRQLRLERQWSQDELGDRVGVRGNTVSRWERGQNLGKSDNLERIAGAFDMTVGQFMAGIQRPEPDNGRGEDADFLDRLERIEGRLDSIDVTLNALLRAVSGSREGNPADQAEKLIGEMEEHAASERRQPHPGDDEDEEGTGASSSS
jgi:transcriptional regulator with XRE-family HTH domain